jgi:hypothetical protein
MGRKWPPNVFLGFESFYRFKPFEFWAALLSSGQVFVLFHVVFE